MQWNRNTKWREYACDETDVTKKMEESITRKEQKDQFNYFSNTFQQISACVKIQL